MRRNKRSLLTSHSSQISLISSHAHYSLRSSPLTDKAADKQLLIITLGPKRRGGAQLPASSFQLPASLQRSQHLFLSAPSPGPPPLAPSSQLFTHSGQRGSMVPLQGEDGEQWSIRVNEHPSLALSYCILLGRS